VKVSNAQQRPALATIAGLAVATLLAAVALLPARASATVWLCKPGIAHDPCETNLDTTLVSPSLRALKVLHPRRDRFRKIDCFYVYPTVSDQGTTNANLQIDPEERSIALYQAARYSQHCRVFAPMYRQVTLAGLLAGTPVQNQLAYSDVLSAWQTYLRKYNHGRGVVLIGHSQGTFVLRRLIAEQIDPNPAARRKLVSAILLGGNVLVQPGQGAGADFQSIGACRTATQLGCDIAFSTFDAPVPANALFGHAPAGLQVLCTNPAALAGGPAPLSTVLPVKPFAPGTTIALGIGLLGFLSPAVATPWIEVDGGYSGQCSTADNASVLQISATAGSPRLNAIPDATWGVHLADANIALGNLNSLVDSEARSFVVRRHCRFTPQRGWFGCRFG
jgi:Protein of unknown function (DUF3089)